MLRGYKSRVVLLLVAILAMGFFLVKKHSPLFTMKAACTDVTADFTDPNFLNCVSTAIGTPGTVCREDAAALSGFFSNCQGSNISSIAGAQYLTGIGTLYIPNNNITDLSPLSGLTNITRLLIYSNNINDLSPISSLTNLSDLELHYNNITDLSPLSSLTSLIYLTLEGNTALSNLTPISTLTNLQHLNISYTSATNLNQISTLTNIRFLYADGNGITNISALSGMTNLTSFSLSNNNISDISPLSGITASMGDVYLSNNNISDASVFSGKSVGHLSIGGNNLTDISFLDHVTITVLYAEDNNISILPDFGSVTNLLELNLNNNNISGLSPFSNWVNAQWFWIQNNSFTDLSPLNINPGFADGNWAGGLQLNISNNAGLNGINAAAALAQVAILESNGATVTHTISICGNGIMEGSETCDDGNVISGDGCDSSCQLELSCGDNIFSIAEGELCDDGNTSNGDGCDSSCQPEHDFGCSFTFDELPGMSPTDVFCATACHDAFGYPGGYAPDGSHCFCVDQTSVECDALCVTLAGFGVTDPVCEFVQSLCGDGLISGSEQCDDGNLINGDGCSSTCKFESVCGEELKLLPDNPEEGYGVSVDIDGIYAIVGAYYVDGGNHGTAYIYKRDINGWSFLTKLTPTDLYMGLSVSISGDYAIVGSDYGNHYTGAAYIFYKNEGGPDNWGRQAKLTASDGELYNYFGQSVSIDGDYVIVGAPFDDDSGDASGSAYIFEKPGGSWNDMTETAKVTANDGGANDGFGYDSVSISGDYAIVGTGQHNGTIGAAYIFKRDRGWLQQAKITASDGVAGDYFGRSVAIAEDYVAIGANGTIGNLDAVYIFKKPITGWTDTDTYLKKITSDGGLDYYEAFGSSVSISGDYLFVGAVFDPDNTDGSGSVYIFNKDAGGADNWGEIGKITASDGAMSDNFGSSVSFDGSNIIVGSRDMDSSCLVAGAAYIYPFCVAECGNNIVEWEEQCDDGNLTDGDGCSSTCATTCGDNFLIRGEQCDDGNLANGDGCSATCELEDPAFYVDYDNGHGADCSILHPCKTISSLFGSCDSFKTAITGIKNINVFVKGTRVSESADSLVITAPGVHIQPWGGNTPVINFLNVGNINNVVFDGFEITGGSCEELSNGASVLTYGNNITFRNNYIHDIAGLGMFISSGDNFQINNNIFSNNTNNSNSCGGILMTGTTNSSILNNTFYNNCDVFDDTNFGFGDLAVTQYPNWGIPSPQNTTVKQNIVFNNAGGNSYYYDVTGKLINGVSAVGVLTNQSAVDHGGYNFLAATNPYKDAVSAVNWATAGTGFPLADSQYINYQIDEANLDPATPLTDYLGNIRPNGKSEAGAIEREQTGGGGSTPPPTPVCMASTVKLDLPTTLSVSQIGGKPAVTLNWVNEGSSTELNTRILFDYFNQSKKPVIGTEGKLAENVFAKYALSEIAKDTELLAAFNRYIGKVNFDSLSDCACNEDEARYVVNAVRDIMTNVTISVKVKSLVTGFMNDILVLERVLSDAGQGATTPFTDFYMANSGITVTDAVTLDIYRNSNLIKSMDSSGVSSYTDDTVPVNNSGSVKYYDYYIVTKNKCSETSQGSAGQARIDPSVQDGTTVQVSLDLAIKIKEGYSQLFMEKLKNLLIQKVATQPSNGQGQENLCEQMRQAFLVEKKTDMMFPYILECFGGYDYLLRQKIEENRFNIVPPLLNLLRLNEGKETKENIVEQYMYPLISKFNDEISLQMTIKADISSLNLTAPSIVNKTSPGELTEAQMDEIRKIDEKYFEGAGQAADIVIEKYDADNNPVGTYYTHTDVFGIAKNVSVGDMTAGKAYTLKIRLKDAKYTLPKIVEINVGSAIKTGSTYSTVISLNFTKHFRYGDFNEDGKIDLLDLIAWGSLIKEHPDLWQEANIDGLYGIDLLDVVTLQGNWGGLTDAMKEGGTMSIADLLEIFGLTLSPSLGGGSATVAIPSWINILTAECL